jgi:hypothetical protein
MNRIGLADRWQLLLDIILRINGRHPAEFCIISHYSASLTRSSMVLNLAERYPPRCGKMTLIIIGSYPP